MLGASGEYGAAMRKLHLHEEVLLLALREDKGTIEMGAWYSQAVGGAVVAELLLEGRVHLVPGEGKAKKELLEVVRADPVGDELLDEWLGKMAADPKPRKVTHWVHKVSGTKDLKGRIGRGLARRGILRVEESKVLLVFSRDVYPELDPEPEREVRARLHEAIFTDAADVDPRTVALLSLAKATGILDVVFGKKELKPRSDRIEAVVNGEVSGAAVRYVVEEINAAILVAVIIPVIVS
jgi:hypothetical protein